MCRKNVMIVEDEFIVAADLKTTLERRGYTVDHIINTGRGAVDYIREMKKPDCILMDVSLKDAYSGIEAAEEIHKEHQVPIIFLTANNTLPGLQAGLPSPLCSLVAKPFDENELIQAIETSLGPQKYGGYDE
ncbi:hypothetical protein B4O97_08190 [Marispirochaeta aestuarii]|uniref:Response regulatory domain-containing protein n=1 Tax=Marispirochaeta aestuarii TaxID=1963862 RepID=A0A1Y1S000_9SPIO|nr:response regulator [Marispirochaeta aestuarii]ORC35615.1 hypothetical protein B4O97_08190 [Marispirochaeta aestuarii]